MSTATSAAMDSHLARPGSIPLDTHNQTFHKYTVHVVDGHNAKPVTQYASQALKTIVNPIAPPATKGAGKVEFPSDSTPHSNHHLRITNSPVNDTRKSKNNRPVENVFFVVDLHNPKPKKASFEGSRRDNRKFNYFSEPKLYDLDNKKSLQEKLDFVCPEPEEQSNVERQFAVYFEHDKFDLNDLPSIVGRPTASKEAQKAQQTLQESTDHYIGQLIANNLKRVQSDCQPIIRGNRVFVQQGSKAYGLIETTGLKGTIIYGENGKGSIHLEHCSAHFFQKILVSDFLQQFFGNTITSKADSKTLERISGVLKGVQIIVASRKDEPSKLAPITGIGYSIGQASDSLQAIGLSTSTLKFPDMPLINIGSVEKPDFRPAELCKIVSGSGKEQIFGGKLPVSLSDEHFHRNSPANREDKPHPSLGDPFPKSKAEGFSLCFVNLTTEVNGKPSKAVNDDVMDSIKEELGNRYGGTLGEAVKEAKDLDATSQTLGSALSFPPKFVPSIKSVLIVVVPHGFSVKEIDKIKNECHLRYGMQCCIVDGREATRRYHPLEKLDMILLTGGLVRKMFAKANIPSQTEPFGGLSSVAKGHTIGVHVSELASNRSYLIDMVSISDNNVVRVSNEVMNFTFSNPESLDVVGAIISGVRQYHNEILDTHTTVFLSGIPGNVPQFLGTLHQDLDLVIGSKLTGKPRVLSLTSIVSDSRVLMAEKDKRIILSSNATKGREPIGDMEINNLRSQSENVASKAYNVPPHVNTSVVTTSYTPSLETFSVSQRKEPGPIGSDLIRTKFEGTALTTHSRPTVLYLAQEASKHSRLHVYSTPADKSKLPKPEPKATKEAAKSGKKPKAEKPVLDYHVTAVHEQLKDTFYFL